jgi:hypothetical protein
MQRRTFLWGVPGSTIAASLALSGCATTPAGSDTMGEQTDKRRTIDAGVDSTPTRLYYVVPGARELVVKSNGLLVFPTVINAGIGRAGSMAKAYCVSVENRSGITPPRVLPSACRPARSQRRSSFCS